ncbi:MAG: hypothetical protein ACR652_10935 [Methylocystis sp.]|uniref:hypothetical protein n=1 Tax=Methylocystis sp. TaxID=1911079 RepID=UPI003DA3717C
MAETPTPPDDDAEIFRLAAAFAVAWEYEKALPDDEDNDDAIEAALAGAKSIVARMIDTPARTLAGVRAKAEALNWCHGGVFEGICPKSAENVSATQWPPTMDLRLADSVLFDLLAIANPASAEGNKP